MMTKPPIFILSCERSGSTLLQTLLDAHPSIAMPPETDIYSRFSDLIPCYGDLSQRAHLRRLVRDLLSDWRIQAWGMPCSVQQFMDSIRDLSRAGVFRALFECYARNAQAPRWGEKTTNNVFYLRQILADFPEAQFIHLVRDGRDVAESLRRVGWGVITPPALASAWRRHLLAVCEALADAGPPQFIEVRYEDLVQEPQRVLRTLFGFLDEPYVDAAATYDTTALRKRYSALDAAHASLQGGIVTGKIGRYRERLTRREIEVFESLAGRLLDRYGYAREFADPRPPSTWDSLNSRLRECLHRLWLKCAHLGAPRIYAQHILRSIRRRAGWGARRGLAALTGCLRPGVHRPAA